MVFLLGDVKLFNIEVNNTYELVGESVAIEKSLQNIIECNTEQLLGINFLASEYSTGKTTQVELILWVLMKIILL